MSELNSICRWGILGTAGIARKNWQAIRRSGNGVITAVASRDAGRAAAWIAENQGEQPFGKVPEAVGGYEELLRREDVDAVYIPLPTGLRGEWVLKAARAGKHVLCEKPCGVSAAEVEELVSACRECGVQFMDGVMFMHSDRLPAARQVLDSGDAIGKIKRITSHFSFHAPPDFLEDNIRMRSDLEPLGCLGDLGWYNIRFSLWAMKYEMPTHVTGRILAEHGGKGSREPVPTEFSGEMFFENRVSSYFYCSYLVEHQQRMNIAGSRGYLEMSDFVLPFFGDEVNFEILNSHFDIQGCEFNMERHRRRVAVPEYANSHASAQETKLFRTFGDLVLSGAPDQHWPDITLKTQRVMNASLSSARDGGREVAVGEYRSQGE